MRLDYLAKPVSEDDPSGPDLDEAGDNDYLNYTMLAPGRMPERFFGQDGQPFDRSTVALDDEVETIARFLRQTRDARLITLEARFQALAGNIVGFSEAIQGLALMVEPLWETFHPRESDGDFMMRQNSIEGLDDQVQVILPLQFAPLAGGGRTRAVTFRNYLVASGKAPAREGETEVPLNEVQATLAADANLDRLKEVYAALRLALAGLAAIRKVFAEKASAEFVPSFDKLLDLLNQMVGVLLEFRPDLDPKAAAAAAGEAEKEEGDGDDAGDGGGFRGPSSVPKGAIKTHADAMRALEVVESFFVNYEPSSPAFVLVHQARMLLGRPLVDAIDALLPDAGRRAVLRFDTGYRFDLSLTQMKAVMEHAFANLDSLPPADVPDFSAQPPPPPEPAPEPVAQPVEPEAVGSEAAEGAAAIEGGETPSGETESMAEPPAPEPVPEPEPEPAPPPEPVAVPSGPIVFRAPTRAAASDLILATEAFFKVVEPSSPIPILLTRARTYLNRDFASILSEMIPKE